MLHEGRTGRVAEPTELGGLRESAGGGEHVTGPEPGVCEHCGHALGPLGEQLVGVVVRERHDGEHLRDVLDRYAGVEQVRCRRDEDAPRPPSTQRLVETFGQQSDLAGERGVAVRVAHGETSVGG